MNAGGSAKTPPPLPETAFYARILPGLILLKRKWFYLLPDTFHNFTRNLEFHTAHIHRRDISLVKADDDIPVLIQIKRCLVRDLPEIPIRHIFLIQPLILRFVRLHPGLHLFFDALTDPINVVGSLRKQIGKCQTLPGI